MVEIKELTKKYGSKTALSHVSFSVGPGEIVGLFGENGAGKTTLLKSMLGLIPCEGQVLLDGEPLSRKNIERLSFATCEHSFFPGLTARAHGEFYREHFAHFREKRFHALMEFFDLPMNKPIRSFSQGQQNQFEVIMALSQGAEYILMDEPFAGNDIFNREDFYKVLLGILEPQETILLSTHLIEEISGFIGRAILIHKGEIIGDVRSEELEEQGISLMDHLKESFNYRRDRVMKAISELTEGEER